MVDRQARRADVAYAMQLLVLTVAYVVTGKLGLSISPVGGFASLVWAPTALSLVALLVGGIRLWPAVAAGAFVINLWNGAPPLMAGAIGLGNTLEAVVGAAAVRRVPGFQRSLGRFADVLAVVVLAGLASTVISATVGTACLVLRGVVAPHHGAARLWSVWWAGDFTSDLILAPLLLTWTSGARVDTRRAVVAEAAALGAVLFTVSAFVFFGPPEVSGASPVSRPSLLFVPLIWAAFRFGTRGAATAVALMAAVAVCGTYTGHGAFMRAVPIASLIALHVFFVSTALPLLALGAVVCERADLYAREQSARAEAQAATRAKDDFLAVLSHELRTPLQSMFGWTQILKTHTHDAAMVEKGLATIERNVRLQTQLIEDLLDVSRIVAGELRLEWRPVDVASVVAAAIESTTAAAQAKAILLDATLGPVDGTVLGDPDRLQQVVLNLLTNAVKFTPRGGRIRVRLDCDDTTTRITVEDSGRGMSAGAAPARLRALPPGREREHAEAGRARPRARHRAPPRRGARRDGEGREPRRGPGCHVHRDPACRGRGPPGVATSERQHRRPLRPDLGEDRLVDAEVRPHQLVRGERQPVAGARVSS